MLGLCHVMLIGFVKACIGLTFLLLEQEPSLERLSGLIPTRQRRHLVLITPSRIRLMRCQIVTS